MKKYVDGFKALIADERGRALIKLAVYIFFVVFVVIYARLMVRHAELKEESKMTAYEKFISQSEYVADISIGENKISLIGGQITSFNYGEEQYVVVDSKLLKDDVEVDDFEIYFWKITPKFIGEVLEEREPEYTSNYKDGLVRNGYRISLYEFIKKYNVSNVNIGDIEDIPDEYIEIILDDETTKIELATLNLDSYYKFVTGEDKKFSIEIKY